MAGTTEEELYSRKADLLKRALAEADRLDKVDADTKEFEKEMLKQDEGPVDRAFPMPSGGPRDIPVEMIDKFVKSCF